jgi:hypothetical protein
VAFTGSSGTTLNYSISNYNLSAVSNGAIKYKISQIKLSPGSKVSVSLSENNIAVNNYSNGEKVSFRVIKYVNWCDGFSPYLSCPYNSKRDIKVTLPLPIPAVAKQ